MGSVRIRGDTRGCEERGSDVRTQGECKDRERRERTREWRENARRGGASGETREDARIMELVRGRDEEMRGVG